MISVGDAAFEAIRVCHICRAISRVSEGMMFAAISPHSWATTASPYARVKTLRLRTLLRSQAVGQAV